MDGRLQIFAGTSHPQLATEIMSELEAPLGRAVVGHWRNGETRVKLEENVRGSDVFAIQSMSAPVDHHLMELLLIIDSLRRASAARITAVIPYFAYAKQEKKTSGREPISAKLVANLLATAGADRILTMDLHSPAIEGFFDIPVDHLRAADVEAERRGTGADVVGLAEQREVGDATAKHDLGGPQDPLVAALGQHDVLAVGPGPLDDCRQLGQDGIHIGRGGGVPEREPQRPAGLVLLDAHRQQDVRRPGDPRRAGGPGRALDATGVQQHQQGVGLAAGEAQVHIAGQA